MRPTLLLTISIAMLSMSSFAQSTARKFTLKNSADGQSELTVYLPSPDALPLIHIFDNSQHLTFAEEIVKSCFESCISWT